VKYNPETDMAKVVLTAIGLILTAAGSLAVADTLDVPNTFTSGTPARASEVNANFSAAEAAVNDNDSRISANSAAIAQRGSVLVYDGNDTELGVLVDINDDQCCISVATPQGYIFSVKLADASLAGTTNSAGSLYYESLNCTGTAYDLNTPAGFIVRLYDLSGVVGLYYASRDSVATADITFSSASSSEGCVTLSLPFQMEFSWPVLPNDPATTGLSDVALAVPIKFQQP